MLEFSGICLNARQNANNPTEDTNFMKQCGHFSHIVIVFLLAMFSVCFLGCSVDNPTEEKLNVSVSILPQEEWVKAIGGDKVNVTVMIPPGSSPHSYEPTFSQMKALANSKIYAAVGSESNVKSAFGQTA